MVIHLLQEFFQLRKGYQHYSALVSQFLTVSIDASFYGFQQECMDLLQVILFSFSPHFFLFPWFLSCTLVFDLVIRHSVNFVPFKSTLIMSVLHSVATPSVVWCFDCKTLILILGCSLMMTKKRKREREILIASPLILECVCLAI